MISLRYDIDANGCWIHRSKPHYGYCRVTVGGISRPAHRVSYEQARGPIPDGLQLDHLCRNRACINPEHLEAVDQRTNLLRGMGWAGVNHRKTHCVRRHEFTPENTYHYRGQRKCRACHRERERNRKHALREAA